MYSALTHDVMKSYLTCVRQENSQSLHFLGNKGSNVIKDYFMLSGRISRNIGENIFRSYTGTTSENTDFHVLVA